MKGRALKDLLVEDESVVKIEAEAGEEERRSAIVVGIV